MQGELAYPREVAEGAQDAEVLPMLRLGRRRLPLEHYLVRQQERRHVACTRDDR